MPGPMSLRWRMVRSTALAAVTTQLAALGHVVGGGRAPDVGVLLLGAVGIGSMTTGLTRRRRSMRSILALLAACQLAFHLLFTLDMSGMAGMPGATVQPMDLRRMLCFHLIATLLSAAVLARGEAALFRLFALLRRVLAIPPRPAPIGPQRSTAPRPVDRVPPRTCGPLWATSPRRGPPVFR